MKTTEKSGIYSISDKELSDLKYYLNNIKNTLLNIKKNNKKEIKDINVGICLFNIDKALENLI